MFASSGYKRGLKLSPVTKAEAERGSEKEPRAAPLSHVFSCTGTKFSTTGVKESHYSGGEAQPPWIYSSSASHLFSFTLFIMVSAVRRLRRRDSCGRHYAAEKRERER